MTAITNVTPECTSITELRIYPKHLIRKMYQTYGIMYPDYMSVSFPHCATTDYSYLCKKDISHGNLRGRHYRKIQPIFRF